MSRGEEQTVKKTAFPHPFFSDRIQQGLERCSYFFKERGGYLVSPFTPATLSESLRSWHCLSVTGLGRKQGESGDFRTRSQIWLQSLFCCHFAVGPDSGHRDSENLAFLIRKDAVRLTSVHREVP